jgi:hypothetical protein
MSETVRYKWVVDGERFAAVPVDEANDANTTHADIADLGRPGMAGVDSGWLWLTGSVLEYEPFNASLDDAVLVALLTSMVGSNDGDPSDGGISARLGSARLGMTLRAFGLGVGSSRSTSGKAPATGRSS